MTRTLSRLFALDRFARRGPRRARIAADLAHLSDRSLRDIGFEPDAVRGRRIDGFLVRFPF